MKKLLTAAGMTGLMMMSAVPATASPPEVRIPSVQVDVEGAQGAENACRGLSGTNGRSGERSNREVQLHRHGCDTGGTTPPDEEPVISTG